MDLLDQVRPFTALEFFQTQASIKKRSPAFSKKPFSKEFLLPDLANLLCEDSFAKVAMVYDEDGIYVHVLVDQAFQDVSFPKVEDGDSIEIFIDTRDLKTAALVTKFCHHFVFLPKATGDLIACEMTRFRSDDSHPHCDPNLLSVHVEFGKKEYEMQLFIPAEALFGYDPRSFKRLGFNYRINRKGNPSQHFSLSSIEYSIEKHPQLWATLLLEE